MSGYPFADPALLAQVAEDLTEKGWQPVWCPLRNNGGCTPSNNPSVTGYDAPYPTLLPQPSGKHRLGFRVPPHLVIIDVDHYEGKQGAHTLDRAEEWLGELPPTYKVTARGLDDPSGRYIYRKPVDLDFSNSALNQFANENGKTDIDILRTGHRFSWAPGDLNHKNHQAVKCYDPDGVICLMPDANDPSIPELPQRWVDYLRTPPAQFNTDAYTRPTDGPQWWLSQPDESLSTDDELKSFAFDMMVSGVAIEDIFMQWLRVAHADDSSWPWDREDFERHTRPQAQDKAWRERSRQEAQADAMPASREQLDYKEQRAREEQDHKQLIAASLDPEIPFDAGMYQEMTHAAGVVPPAEDAKDIAPGTKFRWLEEYPRLLWNELARTQAKKDAAIILQGTFAGYQDIADLPDPPAPETLHFVGKGTPGSNVIGRATITVISGQRSAGKTWCTACWAAQEMRAGHKVIWLDFERQDMLLNAKFKALGVPKHLIKGQLQYTASLPPADRLVRDIKAASNYGQHRVLLVVDAWRTLQGTIAPGTTAIDGDAVEQVYVEYLTPCVEAGANIALLDHLPKSGGSTFGSERKESAPDYVLRVEKSEQSFDKSTYGYSTVIVSKDRYGNTSEGTPVGYLWMPGDGSAEGPSIKDYPKWPELRNWAPEGAELTLDDMDGQSEISSKEEAVLDLVREHRLQLGTRELGRDLASAHPDLFKSDQAANAFARRMLKAGKLLKEEGKSGKYDIPDIVAPVEVNSPKSSVDPGMLRHEEEL